MFLQSLFIILGVSLSVCNSSGEICHLTDRDIAAETDAAEVIFQGLAINSTVYNVSEENEVDRPRNESNQTAVRFFVTRILKGKWRMSNIRWISVAESIVPLQDYCGSAITFGSKYLVFLRKRLSISPRNFTLPPTSFLSPDVVNFIAVSSKETVKLVLHKNLKTRISPPVATIAARRMNVSPGMKIRLVCHTSGFPVPIVKWYKNKVLLFSDVHIQLISMRYESEVVILHAELSDAGLYKCQASNHLGMSRSAWTAVYVTGRKARDDVGHRTYGTRCSDDVFCLSHGRCFQTHVFGHRFCVCSPEFTGIRCASLKNTSFTKIDSLKKTEPATFRSNIEILVIVVAIIVLVSVSLIIMIANLARKLFRSCVVYPSNPVSLCQISPQFPRRSQVEITNLVFTEHTMSSVSNFGDGESKQSLDSSVDLSPQDAVAKSKGDGIEDSFQNKSEKSVPVDLDGDSDPGNGNYEPLVAGNAVYDSDNSDCSKWCLNDERLSDLEVHRESDVDLVEVEPPSGDELYCPSQGLSEMSSRCDTASRTSTSMDCESTSSADLSQRLLRHLYAFPQMGKAELEREEQEEDLSLEEFLGQHCMAMGALPNLKDYLGMMEIDESLTGSYPGSKNFTSEV